MPISMTCIAMFASDLPGRMRARCGTIFRATFAAVLAILLSSTASAQGQPTWNSIGPPGGTISALLTSPSSPSTLFAGTPENGVFFSTDSGSTWTVANAGLPSSTAVGRQTLYAIYALASDGRFVYAATDAGMFYTAGGATPAWSPVASPGSVAPITLLAFDPNTQRLFAAAGQPGGAAIPGVYVSPLGSSGALPSTWTFAPLPALAGIGVGALAVVPAGGALTPAALMASAGGNVYTASVDATDTTLNWVNGDPSASLAASPVSLLSYSTDFQQAYACSGGSVFYSGNPLDAQAIWLPVTVGSGSLVFNCNALVSVPIAVGGGPQLLLGTDQGAFVSQDGVNFAAIANLDTGTSANAFSIAQASGSSASALFVGTGFGVARTDVATLASNPLWTASNGPASIAGGGSNLRLNNSNMADVAVMGSTLYGAAVASQYVEVLASRDGGATWSATHVGTVLASGEQIISLQADSAHSVLFAATTQGLLAYSPTSTRWIQVATSTIAGRVGALALGATMLFVGTDSGLFAVPRSGAPDTAVPVAAGLAGMSVRTLLVASSSVYAGIVDPNDSNDVYVAPEAGAAAGTAVWTRFATTSAGTDRITSLLLVGSNLLASTNGSLVLYASSGSAWASANTSPDAAQQVSDVFGRVNSLYTDGVSIYAATGSNGVYVSPSGSTFSWTAANGSGSTALPSLEVHALRADGTTLYAATRGGIAALTGIGTGAGSAPPPVTVVSSSSGGGAVDPPFALLTLIAGFAALRNRRP